MASSSENRSKQPETDLGVNNKEGVIWTETEVAAASRQQIVDYINARIEDYKQLHLKGLELYEYWKADFMNFTAATYKATTTRTRDLRDFLLQNGVYIPKNRLPIGQQLKLSAEKYTAWPVDSSPALSPMLAEAKLQTQASYPAPMHTQSSIPGPSNMATSPFNMHMRNALGLPPGSTNTETQPRRPLDDMFADNPTQDNNDFGYTPQHRTVTPSGSQNLINLTKLYIEDKKYSGDGDSFDLKYRIFVDLC